MHHEARFDRLRAEFTIEEGKIEEFKKLIQDMSMVEAKEPDTIDYQFYLNRDETKCIVWEIYATSEAIFAHISSVASQTILSKIFSISRISTFEVYGNPAEELQKMLTVLVHSLIFYLLGSVVDSSISALLLQIKVITAYINSNNY